LSPASLLPTKAIGTTSAAKYGPNNLEQMILPAYYYEHHLSWKQLSADRRRIQAQYTTLHHFMEQKKVIPNSENNDTSVDFEDIESELAESGEVEKPVSVVEKEPNVTDPNQSKAKGTLDTFEDLRKRLLRTSLGLIKLLINRHYLYEKGNTTSSSKEDSEQVAFARDQEMAAVIAEEILESALCMSSNQLERQKVSLPDLVFYCYCFHYRSHSALIRPKRC